MRKVAAGLGAGLLLAAATAGVAFAEGSWSSSVSGAVAGFSSRSWQDSHIDSVHTAATFSSCSTDGPGFSSATLVLYDEQGLFPDVSMGSKVNYCNTSDWGVMTRSDTYHWSISAVNGSNWAHLKVGAVNQTY